MKEFMISVLSGSSVSVRNISTAKHFAINSRNHIGSFCMMTQTCIQDAGTQYTCVSRNSVNMPINSQSFGRKTFNKFTSYHFTYIDGDVNKDYLHGSSVLAN